MLLQYFSPTTTITEDGHEETVLSDLSDLHILDIKPSLKTLAQLSVLKYKLDTSWLPHDVR